MLADHPDIFARLRKEILDALGPDGRVNHENVRGMKYLRAVLNGKHFSTSGPQPIPTILRNSEIVPKCVCVNISPKSHHESETVVTVHGMSDVPKRVLSGQRSMGESRSTFQVAPGSTICPG